jgi:hypothetical protein
MLGLLGQDGGSVILAAFTPTELSGNKGGNSAGSGLSRMSVNVGKNGPFGFPYQLADKQNVRFQVLSSPSGQTCIITSDFSGWMAAGPGFEQKEVR